MIILKIIQSIILVFKIYRYLKKKNLLSIYLFCMYLFLPFDLTFLDDEISTDEIELKKKKSIEQTSNNKDLYKYLIGASCILLLLILIFYFNNGDNPPFTFIDNNNQSDDNSQSDDSSVYSLSDESEKKLLQQFFEDTISDLENPAIRKLILETSPKESFVDEADELRKQLEELSKK